MKKNKSTTELLYIFLKPYLKEQVLTLVCILLGSIVSLQYPLILKILVDDVLINKNTQMLTMMIVVYVGLFLLGFLFNFLSTFMNELNLQFFTYNLRKRLFKHLQKSKMAFFDKTSMGEIISNFTADIDAIGNFLSNEMLNIITNVFNILVVITVLVLLNWRLAIFVFLVIPFFYMANILTREHFKKTYQKTRDLVTEGNNIYQNVFFNIKLVKLFVSERSFLKKFLRWQDQVIKTAVQRVTAANILQQFVGVMFIVGNVIIIMVGANMVFRNELSIGGLIAFYTYLPSLFGPVHVLVDFSVKIRSFETSFKRIDSYLQIPPEQRVKSKYRIEDGNIEFRDVWFGYDEDKTILNGFSLQIKPGERVALMGKNGSGKSTLVSLLLKLYHLKGGEILIDNISLDRYSTDYIRRNIGLLSQEINFFNLSVEDNFKICCPRCSQEEIIAACRITGAHEFIRKLPEGYKSIIGERGSNFSGGQLQKMAISRLILKNPKIIVFDEATSALDQESTELFYSLFDTVFKDRTIIFILHDLKNAAHADRLVILKNGVVEKEYATDALLTHAELVDRLAQDLSECPR